MPGSNLGTEILAPSNQTIVPYIIRPKMSSFLKMYAFNVFHSLTLDTDSVILISNTLPKQPHHQCFHQGSIIFLDLSVIVTQIWLQGRI